MKERITNEVFQNIPPEQIQVETSPTVMPGRRNLRLSVTPRCNLRCPHCHNEGQPPPLAKREQLSEYDVSVDSIGQLVATAQQFGVKSIKLTGGDPGVYRHLETLLGNLSNDWQEQFPGIRWGISTNGIPFLSPRKLGMMVDSPLQRVTLGIDSLIEGEMSKPYHSTIGAEGRKLFQDVVVPLAGEFEKTPGRDIKINVVYAGNEERVLSVLREAMKHRPVMTTHILEVNGVMGTKYETRQAYLALLNDIADLFDLEPYYYPSLNQVYLHEPGNPDKTKPAVKFFQDHCADLDCGNCRKIHMRVVPTPVGLAAVPCFLQTREVIPLTTDGAIDINKFRTAISLVSIGPDWKAKSNENERISL